MRNIPFIAHCGNKEKPCSTNTLKQSLTFKKAAIYAATYCLARLDPGRSGA